MEADICIKRHPVFDFRLILVFCTAVRHETLKQSISFLKHDPVNTGECGVTVAHRPAYAVAVHDEPALYIAPDVLGAQVSLDVGRAYAVIFGLLIIG